jgi:hypothetical protein
MSSESEIFQSLLHSLELSSPTHQNNQINQIYSPKDIHLLQQIIYFFNEVSVRDYIMKLLLHELYPNTPFTYLGTFFVKQGDTDLNDLIIRDTGESLKSVFEKTVSPSVVMDYMFTICLVYE